MQTQRLAYNKLGLPYVRSANAEKERTPLQRREPQNEIDCRVSPGTQAKKLEARSVKVLPQRPQKRHDLATRLHGIASASNQKHFTFTQLPRSVDFASKVNKRIRPRPPTPPRGEHKHDRGCKPAKMEARSNGRISCLDA